jgi:tRNA(Ile)-lysidine synthase
MPALPPLAQKVGDYLHCQQLSAAGLVVAVSGGPDSVALLRACVQMCREGKLPVTQPLVIAHLNHRLRGAESDADESFVRELHAALTSTLPNLQLRIDAMDVVDRARVAGINLEAAARQLRYDWLVRAAHEAGAGYIATGHTADDQAETVLHHLLRGTGLRGLAGIAARRRLDPHVELIRPLLAASRADVLAYLAELKQPHRDDSSNRNLDYTRNRIRHELLPQLAAQFNPGVVSALARLAAQVAEAYQDLEDAAQQLLAAAELPRAGKLCVLDRQRLLCASANLARESLRLLWVREGWPMGDMNFEDWERLRAMFRGAGPAIDLPGGISARLRERVVLIGPASPSPPAGRPAVTHFK